MAASCGCAELSVFVIWRRSGDFWTPQQQSSAGHSRDFQPDYPVLESGQTVFMNARHADRKQQSPAGLLRDSPVLSCARRLQRPSDPQVFDQFVANRIKQLRHGLVCEICGLCSRVALTRRMSAVRSRQQAHTHSPLRVQDASLACPAYVFVHERPAFIVHFCSNRSRRCQTQFHGSPYQLRASIS
jgi:hypothetical protein